MPASLRQHYLHQVQGRTAAQVSWVESAGSTWIDAGAGIAIVLDGVTGVTLSDFLF